MQKVDIHTKVSSEQVSPAIANALVVGSQYVRHQQIKFRAWDGNRMRKVFKIIFGNTDFDVFFNDTIGGKEPGHLHSSDSRLSLMRFTGVIDKADCEVYEFDIVKWKQKEGGLMPADQTIYTCVVLWDDFMKQWYCQDINCGEKFGHLSLISCHVAVMSNIYEMPELLEGIQ